MKRTLLLLFLVGCGSSSTATSEQEGIAPGDCSDDIDNDADGDTDCDDDDCANAPECCVDTDGDGVCDASDRCFGGDDSLDTDGDGQPNGCDPCPNDLLDDLDGDGVCDSDDQCPGVDDALDTDGDGTPDACDICPLDPGDDSDGDGICDGEDVCPNGDDRLDRDFDGVADACDPCPDDRDDDTDGDTVCDIDDVCPGGDDTLDGDLDGQPDACDPCPLDANDDTDGDGVCDTFDICPGGDDTLDFDGDGFPDDCDTDADGDGWDGTDDCNDLDASVHPQAGDVYNDGIDSDCDGADCDGELVGGAYFVTCPFAGDQPAAEAHCQSLGYDGLASVLDSTEQSVIRDQGQPFWTPWIGGSDAAFEGAWTWGPGYAFRFSSWIADAPLDNGALSDEDCIIRRSLFDADQLARGNWDDRACTDVQDAVVCEVRCTLVGDADGDGRCDDVDTCTGEDRSRDLDGDGVCDDQDADSELRVYYAFDGSSADLSGQAMHGNPWNGVVYRDGIHGSAADFDGLASYLISEYDGYETDLTVSAWVQLDVFASTTPLLVSKHEDWKLGIYSIPHTAMAYVHGTSYSATDIGFDPLPSLLWVHLAFVVEADALTLYVDGQLGQDIGQVVFGRVPTYEPVRLGYGGTGLTGSSTLVANPWLDGRIDELRIYGRALSPTEITALATE